MFYFNPNRFCDGNKLFWGLCETLNNLAMQSATVEARMLAQVCDWPVSPVPEHASRTLLCAPRLTHRAAGNLWVCRVKLMRKCLKTCILSTYQQGATPVF